MAGRPTSMEDRTRIMWELVKKQKYLRGELLDKAYTLSGMVTMHDGSKVFLLNCGNGGERVEVVVVDMDKLTY